MVIKTLDESTYPLYDELLENVKDSYVFQTRTYLTSLALLGYKYEIVGIFDDDELKYALPVQMKKLPIINKYFYAIPNGIVTKEEVVTEEVINSFINYLKQKGLIIKLSIQTEIYNSKFEYIDKHTTLMLDLSNTVDDIFSAFSKTHRNCTRRAEKDGVVVSFETSNEIREVFLKMYQDMADRKALDAIPNNFLSDVINNLVNNNLGFFAVARFNGVIHNIAFISTIGDKARYLYGASLRTEEKVPPIGQYLHYEIIRELKRRDFSIYDFGGIPNLPVEETDSSYSVYKFKKGFGGEPVIQYFDYQYSKYKFLKFLIR